MKRISVPRPAISLALLMLAVGTVAALTAEKTTTGFTWKIGSTQLVYSTFPSFG